MIVRPLMKWAVVACSVLLVTGFICYQAGAFDRLFRSPSPDDSRPDELFGSSKVRQIFSCAQFEHTADPKTPEPAKGKTPDPALLGGSKTISIGPLVQPPKSPQKSEKDSSENK